MSSASVAILTQAGSMSKRRKQSVGNDFTIPLRRDFSLLAPVESATHVSAASSSSLGIGGFILSEGPARPLSAKAASVITIPVAKASQAVVQVARAEQQSDSLKQKAKSILSTRAGREQAAKTFEEGRLVEGSRSARKSKLETLSYFAAEAGIDLFPLNSDSFGMLLGAMKLAGYRSADTYVSAARVRHIEWRHPMSDELRQFRRSAERWCSAVLDSRSEQLPSTPFS